MVQNQEKRYKLNNKVVILLFLGFFCGIVIFAYKNDIDIFNINNSIKQTNVNVESKLEIKFDSREKNEFMPYKDKILRIKDKNVEALNLDNKVEYEFTTYVNNPLVVCDNKYIIIAERNGKTLLAYEDNKLIFEKKLDYIIHKIKIVDEYILLFLDTKNVQIYDIRGNLVLSKVYSENEYLMDIDYSKKYNKAVVLSILTKNSKVSSKIDYYDIKSNQEKNSIPSYSPIKNDILATNIKIFNNENTVLTADNKIIALDSLGNNSWVKDLSDMKVHSANIYSGEYIILEVNTIKNVFLNKREIITLDNNGQPIGDNVLIQDLIESIDINNNYCLISDSKNIYSISNGKLIYSLPISNVQSIKSLGTKMILIDNENLKVIEMN